MQIIINLGTGKVNHSEHSKNRERIFDKGLNEGGQKTLLIHIVCCYEYYL